MGRWFGYHRVSTKEQHSDRGITGIQQFCDERKVDVSIFCDKQTGKEYVRDEYDILKRIVKPGDFLVLWELDRLGRTKNGILQELKYFKEKEVQVISVDLPTTYCFDLSKCTDEMARMFMEVIMNLMIELYATLAESELTRKKKRQSEGYDAKRARGEWDQLGRPAAVSQERFKEEYTLVLAGKITGVQCRKNLEISESTYYKYKKIYDAEHNIRKSVV